MIEIKKIILFDMDGTIYLGNKLLPHAKELFDYMNEKNIKFKFLTNNSSNNKHTYFQKLTNLGIKSTLNDYYSSIDHTIKYLHQKNYKNIYLLGTEELEKELLNAGFKIENKYEKGLVDCVVVGFDKNLTYKKITDASLYNQDDVEIIATHPDKRCPVEDGYYIPDCGAIIDLLDSTYRIEHLTILGKPHPDMILNILKEEKIALRDALIIGDRLYTDVLCGVNANIDSGLILTGESKEEDVKYIDYKPTFIFKNLKEVLSYLKEERDEQSF